MTPLEPFPTGSGEDQPNGLTVTERDALREFYRENVAAGNWRGQPWGTLPLWTTGDRFFDAEPIRPLIEAIRRRHPGLGVPPAGTARSDLDEAHS